MSTFKQLAKLFLFILFIPTACSGGTNGNPNLKSSGYNIHVDDNARSEKWGKYLFDHLSRRSKAKDIVVWEDKAKNYMTINIGVDNTLQCDYSIKCEPLYLTLKAKNDNTMLWLIYQLMAQLGNYDNRFTVNDLPPAILSFHSRCMNFDFDYREPHYSPNLQADYARMLGNNIMEEDWAIWGHNLKQALGGNKDVYSKQTSWNDIEAMQYCFSNEAMFKELEQYISDNFGEGKNDTRRFMIMPNDNQIVCTCSLCVANGNTENNATPAVTHLVKRLASRFPNHMFFTSAYLTTIQPPNEKLPVNTGVMISTIDLPKGIKLEGRIETSAFLSTLDKWKKCTSNIYIWDYAANFDDYLTPLPVLYGLKEQLKFFKSKGINGVFLNASGYDYSPFDDMKTFVAGSLMMENSLPVDSLCHLYFHKFYPISGKALGDYYLSLEKRLAASGKPYDMYGGFNSAAKTYLDVNAFIEFYNSIEHYISITREDEKARLKKIHTALSYTRLQAAYYRGTDLHGFAMERGQKQTIKPEIKAIYDNLAQYKNYKDLSEYKEIGGTLELYLSNWDRMYKESPFENLLMNKKLEVLSKMDEDYPNIRVLNDGILGFGGEYHQGWHLCSIDDLLIQFDTDGVRQAKNIRLCFLVDPKHHIYLPDKVELYKDGKVYKEITTKEELQYGLTGIAVFDANVDLSDAGTVQLKVYRKPGERSSLACDEIQLN